MAVAFDVATESHTGTAASVSEASFTFSHNPGVAPKGVLVFTFTAGSATEHVTAVTYDGVSLSAVSGGTTADTTTEPMRTTAWFLGSSVPTTDPADVVVTRTNNANVVFAVSYTVNASTNTEVYTPGIVLINTDGTIAQQAVTDGSTGVDSVRFAGIGWGGTGAVTAGAASTLDGTILYSNDPNSAAAGTVHETTAGQGSRPVGFNMGANSDDRAAVHLAVREVVAAGGGMSWPRPRNRVLPVIEDFLDLGGWRV